MVVVSRQRAEAKAKAEAAKVVKGPKGLKFYKPPKKKKLPKHPAS